MTTLRHRLILAEDDFLEALHEGGDSIDAFDKRWASLLQDVEAAEEKGDLDAEILELAHTTAVRLSILIETSMDVLAIHNDITSDLIGQLDDLVSDLSLSDNISLPQSSSQCISSDSPRKRTSSTTEAVATSRKRRRSSSDDGHVSMSKKRRYTKGRSSSPIPSSHVAATSTSAALPAVEPTPQRLGRKRCLSDAEDAFPRPSKRLYAGPRLHAVSDSYPAASRHPRNFDNAPSMSCPLDESWTQLDSSNPFDIQPYIVPSDETLTFESSSGPDFDTFWSMLHSSTNTPDCNDIDALLYSLVDPSYVPQTADVTQATPTDSTPSTPSSVSTSISPMTPQLDASLDVSTILDQDPLSLNSQTHGTSVTIDSTIHFPTTLMAQLESADGYLPPSKREDDRLVEHWHPTLEPLFWLAVSLPDCSQPSLASHPPDPSVLTPS